MTIQTAAEIVQRLGPCRIALDHDRHGELARELALMGCDLVDPSGMPTPGSPQGRTVGFLAWTGFEIGAPFAQALMPYAGMEALVLETAGQDRRLIEQALFEAGWQRHAAGLMLADYDQWSNYALPEISYYQRARQQASTGALCASGVEADALIARYAMTSQHVRPGDHVLVDGDGATEGAAILAALSRAGSLVTGGADLSGLADASIDMIIALEPAVPTDWIARLDDYARLLKYDGRLVLGWRQTLGGNARPRDWEMLVEAVSARFLPETRYVQHPVSRDAGGPYALYSIPLDEAVQTDWLILVASANPLVGEGRGADYDHPAFPKAEGPWPALVDFGTAYDNPYLYRSMVQMGERLADDLKLARLAECVIEDSRVDSADRGAAIAVLGYRILEMRLINLVPAILPLIGAYLDLPLSEDTPAHVQRWRISLAFLAGRLNELTGDKAAARHCYRMAADAEWAGFSPLLATKSIAAAFYEARLHLAGNDLPAARDCFRHGLDVALKAAAFPHDAQIGPADRPLSFYLQELAEVIDMGSQCANALAHFPLWERDPGLFWRQVDIRRFGLASWARDLERENARLRAA